MAALVVPTAIGKLQAGMFFEYDGNRCQVQSLNNGQCTYRLMGDAALKVEAESNLQVRLSARQPVFALDKVPAWEWKRARRLARDFSLILAQNITDEEAIAKMAKHHKIGPCQFKRILARYREAPFVSSCVRMRPGRKAGSRELDARVEAIIDEVVHDEFHKEEATTLKEIHRLVADRCDDSSLKPPSVDTVHRRIVAGGYNLQKRRLLGPNRYKQATAQLYGTHEVKQLNDEWQIDHTQMDIMVVDNSRKYVLGRPWITFVLDVYSRCVVGFYISFKHPCADSVARAFSIAASNKDAFLRAIGLSHLQWEMEGLPLSVLTDHGKDFKSEAFVLGCTENGIEPKLRLVTHFGGHIERLIGTMMSKLHLLRGTTFSNVPRRIKYDAGERAIFTGSELIRFVVACLAEYHNTKHRGINLTPRLKWAQGLAESKDPLRMPVQPKFYRDFLMRVTSSRLRDGFHWGGYTFNSKILSPFPVGQKYTYRVDLMDTSHIYLENDGDLIEVPRVTAVTFIEHELERQYRCVKSARCYLSSVLDQRSEAIAAQVSVREQAQLAGAAVKHEALPPVWPEGKEKRAVEVVSGHAHSDDIATLLETILPAGSVKRPTVVFDLETF